MDITGELIGAAIIVVMGIALFAIYAVGLKYTYSGARNAPGQNVQRPSTGYQNYSRAADSADFYQQQAQLGGGAGDFTRSREVGGRNE
jgi:hypothetical protein